MSDKDYYQMLQPPGPTPVDEICSCSLETPVKLMCALGYNPVYCLACNLEVPPERLNLNKDTVRAIAYWRNLYDAIDRLWLDSGDYEDWARRQLCDINSGVNVLGREVQQKLNAVRKCYYWHFQDESDDKYAPFSTCPVCGGTLQEYPGPRHKQLACEKCGIIGAGE